MSISSIKYANRLNMIDENEQTIGGVLTANDTNGRFFNFVGTKLFDITFADSSDFTTKFICHFNNGTGLYVDYKTTDNGTGQRSLTRRFYIKNETTGVKIKEYSQSYVQQNYDPQHSYRPLLNCKQAVTFTEYDTTPTVANDPADSLSIPGPMYYVKAAVIAPVDLTGVVKGTDLARDWEIIGAPDSITNDTDLTAFKNTIVNGGDGNNPFTQEDPEPEPDPSRPGGGDRPSTDGGDAVDFPGLPTTNVIQTGLLTMYNPDNTKLRSLAGELWGNDFENTIKKILNDPFDGIIGLTLIPFTPTTSGSEACKIGNYTSEVIMSLVSAQWMTLDCGSLTIKESWKNALDYSPATSVEIFIPFVGFRELKTEDVMDKTISLKYNVDLLSGAAIAMVKCGDKVMYTYPCKLTYDVPLTGSNRAALYTGMINIAMSAIKGASMGGALGAAGGAATSAIQTATSKQSNVDRTGAITSNTGDLGDFTPYVLIHRPVQSMPKDFKNIKGYQSNITALLSACGGYTEVDYIHLTNIDGATDTELDEIETLLKEGVII